MILYIFNIFFCFVTISGFNKFDICYMYGVIYDNFSINVYSNIKYYNILNVKIRRQHKIISYVIILKIYDCYIFLTT